MSGHSKWSTIKRKKEKADAERGKIFTKLIREITTAARQGGGDESANPRLRTAILAAKAANMPQANIEKAIKKGTGELPGVVYEEKTYEGYGPGGVAVFVEAVTDNKNRTVAEMRHLFSKYGGNLGENGSVAWIFERKGLIRVPVDQYPEEDLLEIALECGAEDMQATDDFYEIYTSFEDFHKVRNAFEEKSIVMESAELTMIPQNTIKIEGKTAEQMLKLLEALDDHDDVQNVYANFEMEDAEMERLVSNE